MANCKFPVKLFEAWGKRSCMGFLSGTPMHIQNIAETGILLGEILTGAIKVAANFISANNPTGTAPFGIIIVASWLYE